MNNYTLRKPKIKNLVAGGVSAVDMHTHSKHSDGFNKIRTILKRINKRRYGIALTDHSTSKGCVEAMTQHRELLKNSIFIPSMEVNCFDGPHLLCYFYNLDELVEFDENYIKPYRNRNPNGRLKKDMLFYADKLKYYNCLVSIAHPCAPLWMNFLKSLRENPENIKVLTFAHALEIINGSALRRHNLRAIEMNELLNKSITAGSDAHSLLEYGSVFTCAEADSVEDFLNAIKLKKNFVIGKEANVPKRLFSHIQVFRRHVPYLPSWIKDSYRRQYPGGIRMRQKLLERHRSEEDDF